MMAVTYMLLFTDELRTTENVVSNHGFVEYVNNHLPPRYAFLCAGSGADKSSHENCTVS